MKTVQKFLYSLGALAMFALSSGASAGPVSFNITAAQFLSGAGYGVDANENSPNLLDVRFSNAIFLTQNFALTTLGQSLTFNFGTVEMAETDAHGGIDAAEQDGLGITAKLTFTAPTGVTQTITTNGVATVGSVSDAGVDFVIDWTPVTISFGNGGSFRLSLIDMSFSNQGTQNQLATITLLSFPNDPLPENALPEPASLALFGVALGSIAVLRRRRGKA